ncbi:MAG TPA: penicillin-binding protein 2 [Pyrinomonadaceae bacterium]|nr:penicillin-binding protein 2 [Pyrinomonadaceae bacterium]
MRQQQQRKNSNKNTGNKKAGGNKITVWRFSAVVVFFALWAVGIGARLVYLQTAKHDFLQAKANEQRLRERKTKPLRGSILDRSGRELAITLEVESLWIDPAEIENPEAVSYRIAALIGEKPKALLSQINEAKASNRRFMWLAREVDRETVEKIKATDVPALRWQKEQKRFYPHGNMAAQVVGFSSREDVGQAGIELTQDKHLRGEQNEILEERDGKGRVLEMSETINQSPRNVRLTIDYAIQYRAEQALAAGIEAAKAKAGTAVVLDPRTGEILAMATLPSFDPNKPGDVSQELLSNRAVQSLYEPGSTFKLVTYASALEEGLVRPSDTFNASAGFIKIGHRTITDSHASKEPLSLTEALARSSNVAAVTIGQQVGKERLYEYIRRFGYGATTGVELPAETRGRLAQPEKLTTDSLVSLSIGYEIGATTMQSAVAYAAIANDGVRVQPHLVKEIREENGDVFFQSNPEKRRVVSAATASTMRQMLEAVTLTGGTGKQARIEGYTAAGKTGTAHKFDPKTKRYSNKYVASFVGFAPAENPAVVIAVMIDEPGGAMHYGGDVAAPIFREIAEQVLPELNIVPKIQDEVLVAKNQNPPIDPTKISLTSKQEKENGDKKAAFPQTNEKPKAVDNATQGAKTEKKTPPHETSLTQNKTKKPNEKPDANEPRQRVVEEKKAVPDKRNATPADGKQKLPQTAATVKTKNESPPKTAVNQGKTKKT